MSAQALARTMRKAGDYLAELRTKSPTNIWGFISIKFALRKLKKRLRYAKRK